MQELFLGSSADSLIPGRGVGEFSHPSNNSQLAPLREEFGAQLKFLLKDHYWVSDDILIAEKRKIPAGDWRTIPIILADLGPFRDLNPYALALAWVTTRSRFAQLGLEMQEHGRMMIGESMRPGKDGLMHAETIVYNHADRDLGLAANSAVGLMIYGEREPLTGDDVSFAIRRRMLIQGIEGDDWVEYYSPETGVLSGIELFIDPNSRKTIKPGKKPMRIDNGPVSLHNRAGVNKYLEKYNPRPNEQTFVVSETTANMYLPPQIHGFCSQDVVRSGLIDVKAFQTNSIFLAGGNTGKPDLPNAIRAEHVVFPGGRIPNSLIVRFANA